jgi:transcriptional regulator with XRE-family HTH domain
VSTLEEVLASRRPQRLLPEPPTCRLIRQSAGATQADVAAELRVARVTISRWETGSRTPGGQLHERYVELLDRLHAFATQRTLNKNNARISVQADAAPPVMPAAAEPHGGRHGAPDT